MPKYEDKAETARMEELKKRYAKAASPLSRSSFSSFGRPEDKAETARIETAKKKYGIGSL